MWNQGNFLKSIDNKTFRRWGLEYIKSVFIYVFIFSVTLSKKLPTLPTCPTSFNSDCIKSSSTPVLGSSHSTNYS